jgi:DNA-directed RNA polymerase specialized sigma24 family protein
VGRGRDPLRAYEAAIGIAQAKGYTEAESKDFASWLFIRLTEGKCLKQPIRLAFIDWLRETRGSETKSPERLKFNNSLRYAVTRQARSISSTSENIYNETKSGYRGDTNFGELLMDEKQITPETKLLIKQYLKHIKDPLEEKIIYLYFVEDWYLDEIAKLFGITESGAFYKLQIALDRIRGKVGAKLSTRGRASAKAKKT